jgi:hypothetical protein
MHHVKRGEWGQAADSLDHLADTMDGVAEEENIPGGSTYVRGMANDARAMVTP